MFICPRIFIRLVKYTKLTVAGGPVLFSFRLFIIFCLNRSLVRAEKHGRRRWSSASARSGGGGGKAGGLTLHLFKCFEPAPTRCSWCQFRNGSCILILFRPVVKPRKIRQDMLRHVADNATSTKKHFRLKYSARQINDTFVISLLNTKNPFGRTEQKLLTTKKKIILTWGFALDVFSRHRRKTLFVCFDEN